MISYTVYDFETGEITCNGTCDPKLLVDQAQDGEVAVLGDYSPRRYYFDKGRPVERPRLPVPEIMGRNCIQIHDLDLLPSSAILTFDGELYPAEYKIKKNFITWSKPDEKMVYVRISAPWPWVNSEEQVATVKEFTPPKGPQVIHPDPEKLNGHNKHQVNVEAERRIAKSLGVETKTDAMIKQQNIHTEILLLSNSPEDQVMKEHLVEKLRKVAEIVKVSNSLSTPGQTPVNLKEDQHWPD